MTFEKLSRMIHKYDAKIFIQLHHPGATTNATNKGGEPAWAPSPVKCSDGSMAKEMTKEDIDYIVGGLPIPHGWPRRPAATASRFTPPTVICWASS